MFYKCQLDQICSHIFCYLVSLYCLFLFAWCISYGDKGAEFSVCTMNLRVSPLLLKVSSYMFPGCLLTAYKFFNISLPYRLTLFS